MTSYLRRVLGLLGWVAKQFQRDARGNVAIIFAFASTAIVVGVGSGIDLSRGYAARQRLSQVATLTCQFSTRPSVVQTANATYSGSSGFQTYLNTVNAYAASSLTTQHWNGTLPVSTSGGSGTNYFSATASTGTGSSTTITPSNTVTELFATVPTTFLSIINVKQMNVHAKVACNEAGTTPQIVNPNIIYQEGFETSCATYCDTLPNGTQGTQSTPSQTLPSSPSYTGATGTQLYITGYCLEIDHAGIINATTPEGVHSAELDCDNGSGSAGNSSITSKMYLAKGNYELRYFYRGRVDQPNLDPIYACATTAADVAWVSPTTTAAGRAIRTNQINVYFDQVVPGTAPSHTTQDGSQQLAGTNLIDVCVYSPPGSPFVERSVKIVVTTEAYYYLSFAADGANDSYGGQIDDFRLCPETCTGSPLDNFPAAWVPASGGSTLLFEDSFQSVQLPISNSSTYYTTTNYAFDASALSQNNQGWPTQLATGWASAPNNQMTFVTQGGSSGTGQYIELDSCTYSSLPCATGDRSISRGFYLDPGYYQISYYYMAMANFSDVPINYAYYPQLTTFTSWPAYGVDGNTTTIRYHSATTKNLNYLTNVLEVFMGSSLSVSTPIIASSSSSAVTTSYNNPDGTTSTTPSYAPDAINTTTYNYSQVNPLLDTIAFVPNFGWLQRTINIKILKPGSYWLTFSANNQSAADGYGPGLDDIKVSALGSPYMSNPPTNVAPIPLVPIPVPAPQPDTIYNNSGAFSGFYIIADPMTPPAADQ